MNDVEHLSENTVQLAKHVARRHPELSEGASLEEIIRTLAEEHLSSESVDSLETEEAIAQKQEELMEIRRG
ncbi:hypothetical protein L593_05970 [Salinarchaeum sp. Harcht-Bsk1]|uniref:hypothetical protein n=1 Tax=Salinarchaeum sp. Harcht-Bsk1 TaxID=1333523 RepID=UPI0003422C0A|nr:hypothetical protein [Salinarchaeum sp. Harcht-Bsk1]AGN01143.1 hypothetical protein L593_05970 [Salinarchaeum sp. Harcht-Bsk1]